jgi:hypothetical protein
LSHAQAENDRENDREITELIHAVASALSILEAFVDTGSLALFSPPNSRRSIAVPAVFERLFFQPEPSR